MLTLSKSHRPNFCARFMGVLILIFIAGLAACAGTTKVDSALIWSPEPADPQPMKNELRPGLSVRYYYGFYRHISEMPRAKRALKKGKPGPPILKLDHKFGEGNVFDSGVNRGVGMLMRGFLRFDKVGRYALQVASNDGFRMSISGKVILNDPRVHSDQLSKPGVIQIQKAGWYPVRIQYFQRKGSATLQLFWHPPGEAAFQIIPAKAYAHIP